MAAGSLQWSTKLGNFANAVFNVLVNGTGPTPAPCTDAHAAAAFARGWCLRVMRAACRPTARQQQQQRQQHAAKRHQREYSAADGAYLGLFVSKESTNGVIWGTDSIAQKDNLLYVGTYYGDPTKSEAAPGAIQVFTKSGRYLRRFDSGVVPLRPYGLKFARLPSTATPSTTSAGSSSGGSGSSYSRPGGSRRRDQLQLLVAGLGNDAVLTYAGGSGAFSGVFTRGDNTTSSAQGPNDILVLGRRLFLTTEGSIALPSGEISFPPHLKSALLSIDIDTRAVTLVATPDPAPNAGFVSLLGLDTVPASTFPGSGGAPVLVVSDFAGGLRFYSSASGALLKTADTSFIDPTTGKRSSLFYGHVRVVRDHIFLAAFDSSETGNAAGSVLRFTLDGSPAGRAEGRYAGTPVWIEPSDKIPRAIGLELVTY